MLTYNQIAAFIAFIKNHDVELIASCKSLPCPKGPFRSTQKLAFGLQVSCDLSKVGDEFPDFPFPILGASTQKREGFVNRAPPAR